jgi:hypothetical protein
MAKLTEEMGIPAGHEAALLTGTSLSSPSLT